MAKGKQQRKVKDNNVNNDTNVVKPAKKKVKPVTIDEEVKYVTSKRSPLWKIVVVDGLTLAVAAWMVWLAPKPGFDVRKPDNDSSFLSLYIAGKLDKVEHVTQMLIAGFFSLFMDVGVVGYHLAFPYHPKFVMRIYRKITIATHLFSGISEIVLGVLAFTIGDPVLQRYCANGLSIASIVHCLTAYFQTGVVFGAKGIMVPGYLYAITIHITNAYRLYHNPTSLVYLFFTFLTLHIYVWCRFFIYFFRLFKAFSGYHYTIAISFSGMLLFPYAMGPIGNFGMLLVCLVYCSLEKLLKPTDEDLARKLFAEHERYAMMSHSSIQEWQDALHTSDDMNSDRKVARDVFDRLDTDHNDYLGINEIHEMLRRLRMPTTTIQYILDVADADHDNHLSFDEFYRYVWTIGTFKEPLIKFPHEKLPQLSDKEKARLVFDILDLDGSNYIGLIELEMLLVQWGMPDTEAEAYISKYAKRGKTISFELFYKEMRPIWEFGIHEVFY